MAPKTAEPKAESKKVKKSQENINRYYKASVSCWGSNSSFCADFAKPTRFLSSSAASRW